MEFNEIKFLYPEEWKPGSRQDLFEGIDPNVEEALEEDEIPEKGDNILYTAEGTKKTPDSKKKEEYFSRDPEIEEGGDFFNIELYEEIQVVNEDRINKDNVNWHDMDEGLFGVHLTGYRDPEGNDYLFHTDPKIWKDNGDTAKFTGEESPEFPLTEGDEYFSVEGAYEFTEGLKEIEHYLDDVRDITEGPEETRWKGLQNAVTEFRNSYERTKV